MKASEFILSLQNLKEQHGDLEVLLPLVDDYWGEYDHQEATIVFRKKPVKDLKRSKNYPPSFVVIEI